MAALLLAAAVLTVTLSQPKLSFDDAYITYRYAYNIAHAQGFVYNPGEHVLGTTTPLYALLLAAISLVWSDLPSASFILGGLGWASVVLLVFYIGQAAGSAPAGLIAAAFIACEHLFYSTLGMETTVYVGLCLAAFALQVAGRPRGAGVAAGLAFVMRWDGILVIAVILLAELLQKRRWPWQAALAWTVIAAPWLIFSKFYFGSIFPNTFFAKAGQARSGLVGGGAEPFGTAWLHLMQGRLRANAIVWAYPALISISLFRRGTWLKVIWPMLLWTALYFTGYMAVGVIGFHWYYAPLVPAVALSVSGGIAYLTELGASTRRPWFQPAFSAVLAGLCLWPQAQFIWVNRSSPAAHLDTYYQVSEWLTKNTTPNSSVALLEIGYIGYRTHRPVVDIMGLVTPSMLGHLDNWNEAFYYAVTHTWPDYVVALQGMAWTYPLHQNRLGDIYSIAARLENPADPTAPVLIYRRRPDFPPASFAQQWPQDLVFDQRFGLERIQAGSLNLEPGQSFALALRWTVSADITSDYHFELDLLNLRSGERQVLKREGQPLYDSAPTMRWRRGDHYTDDLLLTVPNALRPGAYRILLRVLREGSEIEPVQGNTGLLIPAMTGVLKTTDPPAELTFTPARLEFAEGITLLGYQLEPASRGNHLGITLYWRTDQQLTAFQTVFVHVLDAHGKLLGQHDGPPAAGALPAPLWAPGITVVDPHSVALAEPVPPGSLFCVGLYGPTTLQRAVIQGGDGYDIHDNEGCRPLQAQP